VRSAPREPPAPSAGEARTCVPISDARAGPQAPPLGAPPPETAATAREGAVDSGARDALSLPLCLAVGQGRVHERLVLWPVAMVTHRRTTTESNRCSGVALRTAFPRSHCTGHATLCSRSEGCVEQSLLPEGTRARCVERGRANPDCQRAPGSHRDARVPDSPARVSSPFHGALPASATSTGREPESSSGFAPVRMASDDPGALAAAAPCGSHQWPSPTPASCGARVNGSALHGSERLRATECALTRGNPPTVCLIEMKPEHGHE
jgi:hypothetical protein